ncbi:MAG: sugar phosphate isomerase/epimerase family protein [Bacteroidota bacterium]
MQSRRQFIKSSAVFSGAILAQPHLWAQMAPKRKFKISLQTGAIGVSASQMQVLDMASNFDFEAIAPYPDTLQDWSTEQKESYVAKMTQGGLVWGSAGLPLEFRKDEKLFREGLKALPKQAKALQSVGAKRMHTWIMPTQAERTYRQNFALHKYRLSEVADILDYYGIQLGLEYVGPKTLMARDKYAFIRSMAELRELIFAIDAPNLGFVLDSFHWYCAEESQADLLSLSPDEIVAVDLNDARINLGPDKQIDNKRELPGATAVIDIKRFLEALVLLGYEGPVRAEPFNQTLNDMADEAALKATRQAIQKCIDLL